MSIIAKFSKKVEVKKTQRVFHPKKKVTRNVFSKNSGGKKAMSPGFCSR